MNSTLKVRTPETRTLIDKIKADLKKRAETKAKRMLLKEDLGYDRVPSWPQANACSAGSAIAKIANQIVFMAAPKGDVQISKLGLNVGRLWSRYLDRRWCAFLIAVKQDQDA